MKMLVEHNIHRICNDLFISEYAGFTTESTAGYVFTSIKCINYRWIVLDCVLVTGCNAFGLFVRELCAGLL